VAGRFERTRDIRQEKGRDMGYAQDDTLRAGMVKGVGYFALLAVGFVALLFAAWKWDTARTNEAALQSEDALVRDIDTQLPPGTPRADIEKFLTTRGMPEPGYFNFHGPNPRGNGETAVVWTRTAAVGNSIHGCWIPLIFRLDGSDALMGYSHEVRCSSYLFDGNRDQGTPLLR
jgi:hypothetical protein